MNSINNNSINNQKIGLYLKIIVRIGEKKEYKK